MLNLIVRVGCLFCAAFLCSPPAMQAQSWEFFSPPDKSLTVELPSRPIPLANERESLKSIFKGSRLVYSYTVDLTSSAGSEPEISFGALRVSKPLSNIGFDATVNSNMLSIAGDDKSFSKQADVVVGGYHGREFVYTKGHMSGRALFVNGESRIYFLVFFEESEDPIPSEAVARIFRTFSPRIQRRPKRPTND